MTGCADCDEWVRDLAARAQHPAEPAFRHCPACGRDVVAYDIRPSDHQEEDAMPEPKQYARDANGRLGRVMMRTKTRTWLRPIEGGREWDVPLGSETPCDADGNALTAEAPA